MLATRPATRFEQAQTVYSLPIKKFAKLKFRSLPGIDAVELEQEFLEVLWLVCNTYDPDQGANFNTFFWTSAKRRFLDLHKAASRQKRVGDYYRVPLDDDSVRVAIEQEYLSDSSEDEAMAFFEVREQFRSGRRIK